MPRRISPWTESRPAPRDGISRSLVTLAAAATLAFALWRVATISAGPAEASRHATPTTAPLPPTPTAPAAASGPHGSIRVLPRGLARVSDPGRHIALDAVRARLQRAHPDAPAAEVDRWIVRLATKPRLRAWLEEGLGRMSRYEPLVREVLRSEGVPEDLLYLGLVESQFDPGAVSRAGAAGVWQFMPVTGRLYDLEVSAYVDERLDPVRSTVAAVRHLGDLHRDVGSWHLALAAYNAGAGRVSRALRTHAGNRQGDEALYWAIRARLPPETRTYVPLFLATVEIARAPAAYGLSPRRAAPLGFDLHWVDGGVPLARISAELGIAESELRILNPHLVRGATPPGRRWAVRVPRHSVPSSAPASPTR